MQALTSYEWGLPTVSRSRIADGPNAAREFMMPFTLVVNGVQYTVDVEPETPLLWVIRDAIGLTGTKYGCGIAQCGACMVHIDGEAVPSCITPARNAVGTRITTIEGLSADGTHPVQLAWKEFDVPQCGYCQSGMIMSAVALLRNKPKPTNEDVDREVGNACRCGTYHRVRQAIHRAAEMMSS